MPVAPAAMIADSGRAGRRESVAAMPLSDPPLRPGGRSPVPRSRLAIAGAGDGGRIADRPAPYRRSALSAPRRGGGRGASAGRRDRATLCFPNTAG
jgi:hypothetical protein